MVEKVDSWYNATEKSTIAAHIEAAETNGGSQQMPKISLLRQGFRLRRFALEGGGLCKFQ